MGKDGWSTNERVLDCEHKSVWIEEGEKNIKSITIATLDCNTFDSPRIRVIGHRTFGRLQTAGASFIKMIC